VFRRLVMRARIGVLTIGVDDLERSLAFYRDGLGLDSEGIVGEEFEHGAVVFFDLQGGLKLALWARDNIAHDATVARSAQSPTEFTIGHNVKTKEEVDVPVPSRRLTALKVECPLTNRGDM
jgi:uncharacterized protein